MGTDNNVVRWRKRLLLAAAFSIAGGTLCTAGAAAPVALPGSVEPGRDRPLPALPAPDPDYEFRIEAPQRSPVPRDVDAIHFKLTDIRIDGAKTVPAEQLTPLYRDLVGKEVTLGNIFDVAEAIENIYRKSGYPLVRAYVPPQRVADGVFTIRVVEGRIAALSVEGGSADVQARIRAYLAPAIQSQPLKLPLIERGLLLANDLPGVTASGVLKPATNVPGASDLIVTADQPWINGGLATDNRGSRFSGLWTITGDATLNGLVDGEDSLNARFTVSPHSLEQIGGQLRYSHPLNDNGLTGSLVGIITHGEPGSSLSAFNVRTDSFAVGPRLSYPLIRSRAQTLILDGGFTVQNAKVDVLGAGISHDRWRVLDMAASYLNNDFLGGNLALSVDVAQGLDILGATANGSTDLSRLGAKTDFTKLTGGARFLRSLGGGFGVALTAQGQYAVSPLITGEQMTFGGRQIGRGYDPGAVTGDHGIGGSVELRYDRRFADLYLVNAAQPYIFYDTAQTWYDDSGAAFDPSLVNQTIASFGGGMRFWLDHGITAGVEAARTLRAVPGSDGGTKTTKVLFDAAIRF